MRRILLPAIVLIAFGCTTTTTTNTPPTTENRQPTTAPKAPLFGPHGFDVTGMDQAVNACDDFYRFAVGKWRETHPLPAQYSRFGRFEEVAERNRDVLHSILEEDAASASTAPRGSAQQKIGDFYAACMNETSIDTAGITPIQPELDRINAISDRNALLAEVTRLHDMGYAPLFRVGGQNDFKNSKMIIASVGTGQLGLPDRDYYLRDDERFKNMRSQYIDHITTMLTLAAENTTQARSGAERILQIETRLAQAEMSRVELRIPENRYHMMAVSQLASMAPVVDWNAYLSSLGVNQSTVNVTEPKYIEAVNRLLSDTPLEDWKTLLRWDVINSAAPALSRPFEEEEFNFNGRVLSGQQQQQERWKRCVRATDASLGQLLGQEYVRRNFTPEAKAKMNQLIDNLVAALREDIPTLSWMSPQTQQAALTKLNAFSRKIGYPDKWRDYSALDISRDSYFQDVLASRRFAYHYNLARIGKADDPNEWGQFTPPTVNASYNPPRNDITFPAGILQPPFYDPNAEDAYNYGGIGVVIGHEMTHGFDDQGAKYDAEGNLRNWWTDEDLKNFQGRTNCISTEYSEFNVAPGININGKLVTGEATADLGGATIALRAYEKSLQGKKREVVDGFTPEQRFFLGFAQVWGENMSPQEATRRALTDPHAQGPFRVNGTVQNMPEFWKAYGCNEGQPMVRDAAKRCSI
ncbi:MAG TPA: M13 family metallopeptidase, partial [Thermoanaerobaculia bacterium]